MTYGFILAGLQLLLCRMNQALNVEFVRFVTNNLGEQEIWPEITKVILNHPCIPYLIPLALMIVLVISIISKNDNIPFHAIALSAIAFCLYLIVSVFAILLPFTGTIIQKLN